MQAREKEMPYAYDVDIVLAGVRPLIWRLVRIPARFSLWSVHNAMLQLFGWDDDHGHEFAIREGRGGYRSFPDVASEMTEDEVTFFQAVARTGSWPVRYEYDFGDSWRIPLKPLHEIGEPEAGKRIVCLAGENAGPPEDCGGVWGYEEILEALRRPNDPDYEDRREWVGADFDPKRFDLDAVNKVLRKIR